MGPGHQHGCSGEWNSSLTLYHAIPLLTNLRKKALENTAGKGENAGY